MSIFVIKPTEFVTGAVVSFMDSSTPKIFTSVKQAMAYCREYLESYPWMDGVETAAQAAQALLTKRAVLNEFEEGIATGQGFYVDGFIRFDFAEIDESLVPKTSPIKEYWEKASKGLSSYSYLTPSEVDWIVSTDYEF